MTTEKYIVGTVSVIALTLMLNLALEIAYRYGV